MSNQSIILRILVLLGLSLNGACSSQSLPLRSVYSANVCNTTTAETRTLQTQQEFERVVAGKLKHLSEQAKPLPQLDFSRQSVILVAVGQQSSTGYAVVLKGERAVLKNHQLILPVTITRPAAGSLQAQVISSPCRVLSLPKVEYDQIVLQSSALNP